MLNSLKKVGASGYKYWMLFAQKLAFVNTLIILSVLYVVIVPWVAIPLKFSSSKPLGLWKPLKNPLANEKHFHYQF